MVLGAHFLFIHERHKMDRPVPLLAFYDWHFFKTHVFSVQKLRMYDMLMPYQYHYNNVNKI